MRSDRYVALLRERVDQAWSGTGVAYIARLGEQRKKSLMSRIVGTSEYQQMTTRNEATTTGSLVLIDEDPARPPSLMLADH